MRVQILGDNLAARTLRGYIHALQYAVVDNLPDFTIYLLEGGDDFIIDGVDCELERKVIKHLEELGAEKFILARKGGIRSDRELRVLYPKNQDQITARAIARGLLEAFGIQGASSKVAQVVKATAKALSLLVLIVFFLPTFSYAQQFVYGRAWDSVNLLGIDPGDSTNRAVRVNCIVGCGSGGTSNVNLIQLNSVALGSPSNYGTSPGVVSVIGVNAFVTNTVGVTATNSFLLDATFTGRINTQGQKVMAASTPVVLASDQSSIPVANTPPANQSINIVQEAGTNLGVPQTFGTAPTGVVLGTSSDIYYAGTRARSNQTTTAAGVLDVNIVGSLGITNSVTNGTFTRLTDNTTGVGVIAATTALKTDLSSVAGTATVTSAAGVQKVGIVGNANAAIDAADNAAPPANEIAIGTLAVGIGVQPTNKTGANIVRPISSTEGVVYTQEGNSNRFSCIVASTATVTTQCQAAPGAGLRAYVTSVSLTNAVQTAQSIDVVFGTGAACVTGTTALTHKIFFIGATETGSLNFQMGPFPTPLVPTAANAICLRPTAATAFGGTVTGYIAP